MRSKLVLPRNPHGSNNLNCVFIDTDNPKGMTRQKKIRFQQKEDVPELLLCRLQDGVRHKFTRFEETNKTKVMISWKHQLWCASWSLKWVTVIDKIYIFAVNMNLLIRLFSRRLLFLTVSHCVMSIIHSHCDEIKLGPNCNTHKAEVKLVKTFYAKCSHGNMTLALITEGTNSPKERKRGREETETRSDRKQGKLPGLGRSRRAR